MQARTSNARTSSPNSVHSSNNSVQPLLVPPTRNRSTPIDWRRPWQAIHVSSPSRDASMTGRTARPFFTSSGVRGFNTSREGRVAVGRLDGRIALVTGGSGGIGRAAVLALAKEGADVALQFNRGKEAAQSTVAQVQKLGRRGIAAQADVSEENACQQFVNATLRSLGRIDIVACFAGHPFRREEWYKPFEELTPAEIQRPIAIDLLGSAYVAQAAAPSMAAQGHGSIILVGSTPALTGDTVGIP